MPRLAIIIFLCAFSVASAQQVAQAPSPMLETTRPHKRVPQTQAAGRRVELQTLKGAVLFIGPRVRTEGSLALIIHFHGAPWLVESHVATHLPRAALITLQLGAGSSVYNRPFDGTDTFVKLLDEARQAVGPNVRWSSITLTSWSAGYGAVRAILRDPHNFDVVNNVLLLDGIHASYVPEGKPLADGGTVNAKDLDSFESFARAAVAGEKVFVITHSEIFPGSYASTTESTDHLLRALSMKRRANLKHGPLGMQQLSSVDLQGFHIRGFAGNTAPDHVDYIHAMPKWFRLLKIR